MNRSSSETTRWRRAGCPGDSDSRLASSARPSAMTSLTFRSTVRRVEQMAQVGQSLGQLGLALERAILQALSERDRPAEEGLFLRRPRRDRTIPIDLATSRQSRLTDRECFASPGNSEASRRCSSRARRRSFLTCVPAREFRRPPIGEDVGRFLAVFQKSGVSFEQDGQVLVGRLKSRLGLGEAGRSGQDIGDPVLGTGGGPSRSRSPGFWRSIRS